MVAKRHAICLERSVQSQQLKVGLNLFSLFLIPTRSLPADVCPTYSYHLPNGALKANSLQVTLKVQSLSVVKWLNTVPYQDMGRRTEESFGFPRHVSRSCCCQLFELLAPCSEGPMCKSRLQEAFGEHFVDLEPRSRRNFLRTQAGRCKARRVLV